MKSVLQTCSLTKKYGKEKAVNKVSLNIEKGDIYGLIGKNGAGKTTIMKMICGLASQSQGDIKLFGSSDLKKGRKRIGATIEQPALYPNMTAKENLIYYNKLLGITDYSNAQEILSLVGLEDTGKKKTKSFSMGMKQRLSIAISLIGNPDFLILDEPTNGLDPLGIKQIRELLLKLNYENEITILISSHILGELDKIATRYGVIKNGELIDELSAYELEKSCEKCISLVVNDSEKAVSIIKNIIKSNDYEVLENGVINIYDFLDIPEEINKALVENSVLVSNLTLKNNDIESYFIKMMGED
ncbi:ABC transporter ATP-binding protein [Tissierella pigra]|uniref:ABC transporter ATP-binding protein n=1 Tax=Tissierella pigra TaxID=2607614 RepID=A0A6N7XI60_9FIRM|nr:ABC transporter ATP-binding protein [Tissierella pigra]MBU5427683.1 ABC transporter ATP-binding protein [Tissierella pigra]MSU00432.1 ABC transporter ATP-binding protein [Tissierella pigra]